MGFLIMKWQWKHCLPAAVENACFQCVLHNAFYQQESPWLKMRCLFHLLTAVVRFLSYAKPARNACWFLHLKHEQVAGYFFHKRMAGSYTKNKDWFNKSSEKQVQISKRQANKKTLKKGALFINKISNKKAKIRHFNGLKPVHLRAYFFGSFIHVNNEWKKINYRRKPQTTIAQYR